MTEEPPLVSIRSYRELLKPELLAWGGVALFSKVPVALAPLALVFFTRERPGGYTLGAVLAAAYVLGEVVGAPLLGALLTRRRMRLQLSGGLAVGAGAFAALSLGTSAPPSVLTGLAFVAGAAPAACPGGIRAILIRMVDNGSAPRALSAEAALTQGIWAAAPALVVVLALRVGPGLPLALGAVLAALAAVLLFLLREPVPARDAEREQVTTWRALLSGWPIYLTSAAAMAMLATAELLLPALLEYRGLAVGWAGPLLAGFAIASAVGALYYGRRTWPGSVHTQSLVLLVATAVCLSLIVVLPGLPGLVIGLLAAGVFQAGVLVSRNLSLRERLPERDHAAGYSIMYAVQGIGYTVTASLSAVALDVFRPPVAIAIGVGTTLVITAVSALSEVGGRRRPHVRDAGAPDGEERASLGL